MQIDLTFPSGFYSIDIHRKSLDLLKGHITCYPKAICFIDDKVYHLYKAKIDEIFKSEEVYLIPSGECHKTREMKQEIEDFLFKIKTQKDHLLVAIGGGMVLDLVGFVAATFMRGVALITVPTTFLAMVDAAVGGKTAVNTPYGKNLIGTIYHPKMIVMDPDFLSTLPEDLMVEGLVEVIKKALLFDPELFAMLYEKKDLWEEPNFIQTLIFRSIKHKRRAIGDDEKDQKMRQLLNLGHTVAHVVESASNHTISHGKAVAAGLLVEGMVAKERKILSSDDFTKAAELLLFYFPKMPWLTCLDWNELAHFLHFDKKNRNETINMVMLTKIGSPLIIQNEYVHPVTLSEIKKSLEKIISLCLQES
jgi:3-dehydroquinate synthase